jgi:hypothetical protein
MRRALAYIAAINGWEWTLRRLGYVRLRAKQGEGWAWAWLREEASGFHVFTVADLGKGEVEIRAMTPFRSDLLLDGVRWGE